MTMNSPSAAPIELAGRLLALEAAAACVDERGLPAASRVYEKLHAHLSPLVGVAGVEMLFVRCAKLVQGEFTVIVEGTLSQGSTKLRERLRAPEPALALDSAATLFGTFFALLTTFIGERLTLEILRRAWPTLDEMPPPQEKK